MSEGRNLFKNSGDYPPDDKKLPDESETYAEKKIDLEQALKKFGESGFNSPLIDASAEESAKPRLTPRLVLATTTGEMTPSDEFLAEQAMHAQKPLEGTIESPETKYEKTMHFLTSRATVLGERLAQSPGVVWQDIKKIGTGFEYLKAHPKESAEAVAVAAERTAKYLKYFAGRDATWQEKGEKIWKDFYTVAENYRKLPLRYKLYFSGALLATGVGLGGVSPLVTSVLASAKLASRGMSGAGFYTLIESIGEERLKKMEAEKGIVRTNLQSWGKHGIAAAGAIAIASGLPLAAIRDLFGGQGLELLHSAMTPSPVAVHEAASVVAPSGVPEMIVPVPETVEAPEIHIAPEHIEHHAVHHHVAAHPKGLSIDAHEKLETKFLNTWQVDHPGTMPTTDQINAYIAENTTPPAFEEVQVTPEVHADIAPSDAVVADVPHTDALADSSAPIETPHMEPTVPEHPLETAAPTELPPLHDQGFIDSHPVPHPLEETSPTDAATGIDHPVDHAADTVSVPPTDPTYTLEHGEAFTNVHNVPVDPEHPGIYRYMHKGEMITFVSGGGSGDEGFQARIDLIQKQLSADPRFWGTKIYWDASEVQPDGSMNPEVGQFVINETGTDVAVGQPTVWDQLFEKKMDLPDPKTDFVQRIYLPPKS